MASIEMNGTGNFKDVTQKLQDDILNSGMTCELIDSVHHVLEKTEIMVMVFEKYYMRSSNRASLTVVVIGLENNIKVNAIGSAGGQGAIFKFSWGAEDDFVGAVTSSLEEIGFI